jgi:hypothetical protein
MCSFLGSCFIIVSSFSQELRRQILDTIDTKNVFLEAGIWNGLQHPNRDIAMGFLCCLSTLLNTGDQDVQVCVSSLQESLFPILCEQCLPSSFPFTSHYFSLLGMFALTWCFSRAQDSCHCRRKTQTHIGMSSCIFCFSFFSTLGSS